MNSQPADADLPRPYANCYWVEPGQLLAGEYPVGHTAAQTRDRLRALLLSGVRQLIDLTEADEPLEPYAAALQAEAATLNISVRHDRYPLPDMEVPHAPEELAAVLDALDAARAAGLPAYVHCWGGIGRTGLVVGCYLVRHGLTGDAALAQLERWWRTVPKSSLYPRSPQTEAQVDFVRGWREPPAPPAAH